MQVTFVVVAFTVGLGLISPSSVDGQPSARESRCADCHVANPGSVSSTHLADWDLSAHGRRNVGCEACHGGDPSSFEPFVAHRGILARSNPASPVHRSNEPATCGTCHAEPFAAFRKSRHFALLAAGDHRVPNCATCHGEVAGVRPSPKGLEAQCAECHGRGRPAAAPEFPARGRQAYEGLREARVLLSDVRRAIQRVKDPGRRAMLEARAQQAQTPIDQATAAAHSYVFEQLEARLTLARTQLSTLFDLVANPSGQ